VPDVTQRLRSAPPGPQRHLALMGQPSGEDDDKI
jgi:hypothetical protein